jgi:hypothetical protein
MGGIRAGLGKPEGNELQLLCVFILSNGRAEVMILL